MLQTAAGHLWWPDAQSQALSDLARDTNWDAGLAATALTNNRETLSAWDKAVQMPICRRRDAQWHEQGNDE